MRAIENITTENFAPFGTLVDFPENPADPRFMVTDTEPDAPWRVAIFRITIRQAVRLECHPTSKEVFTPLSGTGVLLVAAPESPGDWHAFLLNRAVCLGKGVWHEMVTLSPETLCQITENLEVTSEFYDFAQSMGVGVGEVS